MVGCKEDCKGILIHRCQLDSSERYAQAIQAEKGIEPTSWPGSQSSHTGTWEEAMVTILDQGLKLCKCSGDKYNYNCRYRVYRR
jgi:hypothetical protein